MSDILGKIRAVQNELSVMQQRINILLRFDDVEGLVYPDETVYVLNGEYQGHMTVIDIAKMVRDKKTVADIIEECTVNEITFGTRFQDGKVNVRYELSRYYMRKTKYQHHEFGTEIFKTKEEAISRYSSIYFEERARYDEAVARQNDREEILKRELAELQAQKSNQ